MSEEKYREFWIRPSYKLNNVFYCTNNLMNYAGRENIIHVISYKAYADLKDENERLRKALKIAHKYFENHLPDSFMNKRARQALNSDCVCDQINFRNCPVHQNQHEENR